MNHWMGQWVINRSRYTAYVRVDRAFGVGVFGDYLEIGKQFDATTHTFSEISRKDLSKNVRVV